MKFGKSALGTVTTAALLLVVVKVCLSAPLNTTTSMCLGAAVNTITNVCDNINKDVLVELGFEYMTDTYNTLGVEEVDNMNESGLVCELFREYSRLSVTLENLKENDSLHTNLTLLVMIAKKLLIDSCVAEAISSINCSSIGAISVSCLGLGLVERRTQGLHTNTDTHPECWLTQFYQNMSPDRDVWNTLLHNVRTHGVPCYLDNERTVTCAF